MLAAEDPHNPPALLPLSRHSLALYPAFLERVQALSGQAVPRQTSVTVQYAAEGAYRIPEHSIDPRQLAAALLAAAHASGVHIAEHAEIADLEISSSEVNLRTSNAQRFAARSVVHATGAWLPITSPALELPIVPRKGQMLRVAVPADKPLHEVHRAGHVYIVPRTAGPQAGTALIGATVEDAGFDISTHPGALQQLRVAAAALAPQTAFAAEAPLLESWAGLRPSTPDFLPVIGRLRERELIATGQRSASDARASAALGKNRRPPAATSR